VIYRIAVTGGHDKGTAGKRSPDGKYLEYAWNDKRADALVAELNRYEGIEAKRFDVAYPDIAACNDAVSAWKANAYVDLHSNAATTSTWRDTARGLTMYNRRGDKASRALSDKLGRAICAATGLRYRGIGEVNFSVLYGTIRKFRWHMNKSPLAHLIEWGFHTSHPDLVIMTDSAKNAAGIRAMAATYAAYFGCKLKVVAPDGSGGGGTPPVVPPPPPPAPKGVYFTTTPTLYRLYDIGKKFGVKWTSIRRVVSTNPEKLALPNPFNMRAGIRLRIK
jgi:hypothetical protein